MTNLDSIEARAPMRHRAGQRLKMWAVWRDEKIYLIRPVRDLARQERDILALDGASKHKWRVYPCWVSP